MREKNIDNNKLKAILASKLQIYGIGQAAIKELYKQYKSRNYIDHDPEILHQFIIASKKIDLKTIAVWDPEYPKQILSLHDWPLVIFVKGDLTLLEKPSLTIVGTRKCTRYGENVVHMILDNSIGNVCFVSGLAYGIDSVVHERCLSRGLSTIAVVAGGIDIGFPRYNNMLYDRISTEGLVLAEFPPGVSIGKGMFPMRNRLLAALSSKCIVIEAPAKSGALITSGIANELGREVYAVPGQIDLRNSKGVNGLIKMGAEPITSEEDIMDLYTDLDNTHNRLLS